MNIETIEQIVTLISERPVSEITVEQDGERVYVRKSMFSPQATSVVPSTSVDALAYETESIAAASVTDAADTEPEPIVLTSPMVGLFHHLAQPVPYGGMIALNQIVGSIESMKLMNDVPAEFSGRVVEVLIADGAPVEYGQPLFRLTAA